MAAPLALVSAAPGVAVGVGSAAAAVGVAIADIRSKNIRRSFLCMGCFDSEFGFYRV